MLQDLPSDLIKLQYPLQIQFPLNAQGQLAAGAVNNYWIRNQGWMGIGYNFDSDQNQSK